MKRLLCALLAALMWIPCCALAEATDAPEAEIVALEDGAEQAEAPEETPAPDTIRLGFEDGFSLELPEGWLYHPTTEDMADSGVLYCLSDAEGKGWLYVQLWNTDCADLDELKALIDRTTDIQTSGIYSFNGANFVVYDLTNGDVSCCAALMDDKVLNLVFTPQSDAGFMAIAAQILNTFERL